MTADGDNYLERTRAQLRELESRAARVLETLEGDGKSPAVRLGEKIRAVKGEVGEEQGGEISAERRNELNVLCAELRVEVTTLELDARRVARDV